MRNDFCEFPYLKSRQFNENFPRLKYVGSKQVYGRALMDAMIKKVPNADTFVDLFGGGASMSMIAICCHEMRTFYNDFNPFVFGAIDALLSDRFSMDSLPSRLLWDKFTKAEYDEQLLKLQTKFKNLTYDKYAELGDDDRVEFQNALLHCYCYGFNSKFRFFTGADNLARFKTQIDALRDLYNNGNFYDDYKDLCKENEELRLSPVTSMQCADNFIYYADYIKPLISISNLDYKEAFKRIEPKIEKRKTIIYCDIPYKDTSDYSEPFFRYFFNHKKFADWLLEMRDNGWEVFISEAKNDYLECTREILSLEKTKNAVMKSSSNKFIFGKENPIKFEKLYTNM